MDGSTRARPNITTPPVTLAQAQFLPSPQTGTSRNGTSTNTSKTNLNGETSLRIWNPYFLLCNFALLSYFTGGILVSGGPAASTARPRLPPPPRFHWGSGTFWCTPRWWCPGGNRSLAGKHKKKEEEMGPVHTVYIRDADRRSKQWRRNTRLNYTISKVTGFGLAASPWK